MNTATALLMKSSLDTLEVQLLTEDELYSISGGSPFALGCALAGIGFSVCVAGLAAGLILYVLLN
jgi:hypothetical protein